MAMDPDTPFGTVAMNRPSGAITLEVGADYAAVVRGSPEGATFWFASGVHRLGETITPKDGQSFLSAGDAILSGSRLLTEFGRDDGLYVASGQTQQGVRHFTSQGADGAVRAGYPETFYIDGVALTPVGSKGAVEKGTFYFDYGADRIYFADNPDGHLVEAGVTPHAIRSYADGVTVSNLTVRHFTAPTQHGAVQGDEGWTVTHNVVEWNYGAGILVNDGSVVANNLVRHNGQKGIGASGNDVLVEANRIHHNGGWAGIDPLWDGGGGKFSRTEDLVVRNNFAHDNHGIGLWTDVVNIRTTYEGNVVIDNLHAGINHEISYDAVIKNNVLMGNGTAHLGEGWLWGAQIQIQNSKNVEIFGNKIDMSGGLNGIGLIQQDRPDGPYGPRDIRNNKVHDNIVTSDSPYGWTGGVADHDKSATLSSSSGNRFYDNDYHMPDGDHWRWGSTPSGDDWAAFLRDTGQEAGSTLRLTPTDTAGWVPDFDGTGGDDTDGETGSSVPPTFLIPRLIDADRDVVVGTLSDGDMIDRSGSLDRLSVEVVAPGTVASVRFELDGPVSHTKVESYIPYAMFGDATGRSGRDYLSKDLPAGDYTLTLSAFSENDAKGSLVDEHTLSFSIVDEAPSAAPARLLLMDSRTDALLTTLSDGAVIDREALDARWFTVVAVADDALDVDSVRFDLDGPISRTQHERYMPYALFGDDSSEGLKGREFGAGDYSLRADFYGTDAGTGTPVASLDLEFMIV